MTSFPKQLAIDAHVHLHDAENAIKALEQAKHRLAGSDQIGVVMLAERQSYDVLDEIRPQLVETEEAEALWLNPEHTLLVLAGRQIISAEKLEILALATCAKLPDGLSAEDVIAELDAADALVVLPWGVGKWLGKRGALVDRLIAAARSGRLFLGDNGGRPGFWPVHQFSSGLPVLSGSDPLPLPGWPEAIGSFGSIIEADLSETTPAASLKRHLRDVGTSIRRHGRLAGPIQFVRDQARLRLAGNRTVR